MVSKVCLLVLVAFVAFQGISGDLLTREEFEIQQRGLLQEAEAIINKLLHLVSTTVTSTIAKLSDILQSILSFGSGQIDGANNIFTQIIGNSLEQIKQLTDKAAALGVDATKCIGEKEAIIKNLPIAAINDITSCIEPKLDVVKAIIDKAINEVNNIINIVTGLNTELKDCGEGFSAFVCYGKVVSKATLELAKVPLKAVEIVAETTKLVANIQSDLVLCTTDKVETTVKTVTELTADIITCISKAIADKESAL